MIAATHTLIFSDDAAATRAFLRDILGWDNVDAGNGWLIFALPPSELGVHPGEPRHELFLMCHDVERTKAELEAKGVEFMGETFDSSVCHMGFFKDPDGNVVILHRRYVPHG
jgi:catechol 2,3-dioxygenase-like lactoylglutathione lyase family enzyme